MKALNQAFPGFGCHSSFLSISSRDNRGPGVQSREKPPQLWKVWKPVHVLSSVETHLYTHKQMFSMAPTSFLPEADEFLCCSQPVTDYSVTKHLSCSVQNGLLHVLVSLLQFGWNRIYPGALWRLVPVKVMGRSSSRSLVLRGTLSSTQTFVFSEKLKYSDCGGQTDQCVKDSTAQRRPSEMQTSLSWVAPNRAFQPLFHHWLTSCQLTHFHLICYKYTSWPCLWFYDLMHSLPAWEVLTSS